MSAPQSAADGEIAFALAGQTCLAGFGSGLAGDRVDDWLAHALTRQPADLRRHVQRITHLCEQSDRARLAGALADLFLVMGDKGRALRQRMLAQAAPFLSAAHHAWFAAHLERGLPPHGAVPEGCLTLLGSGATGCTCLVTTHAAAPHAAGDDGVDDLLELVSELILQGDLEAACDLLEAEISVNPAHPGLQHELAKLHAHLGDRRQQPLRVARLRAAGVALDPVLFP